jgi:hypothetical protein
MKSGSARRLVRFQIRAVAEIDFHRGLILKPPLGSKGFLSW